MSRCIVLVVAAVLAIGALGMAADLHPAEGTDPLQNLTLSCQEGELDEPLLCGEKEINRSAPCMEVFKCPGKVLKRDFKKTCEHGKVFTPCSLFEERLPLSVLRCDSIVCLDTCKATDKRLSDTICRHCPEATRTPKLHSLCQEEETLQSRGCPRGWFKLRDHTITNGSCYYRSRIGVPVTAFDAEEFCETEGGQLIYFRDEQEWAELLASPLFPRLSASQAMYWTNATITLPHNDNTPIIDLGGHFGPEELAEPSLVKGKCSERPKYRLSSNQIWNGDTLCFVVAFQPKKCVYWRATQCNHKRLFICRKDIREEPSPATSTVEETTTPSLQTTRAVDNWAATTSNYSAILLSPTSTDMLPSVKVSTSATSSTTDSKDLSAVTYSTTVRKALSTSPTSTPAASVEMEATRATSNATAAAVAGSLDTAEVPPTTTVSGPEKTPQTLFRERTSRQGGTTKVPFLSTTSRPTKTTEVPSTKSASKTTEVLWPSMKTTSRTAETTHIFSMAAESNKAEETKRSSEITTSSVAEATQPQSTSFLASEEQTPSSALVIDVKASSHSTLQDTSHLPVKSSRAAATTAETRVLNTGSSTQLEMPDFPKSETPLSTSGDTIAPTVDNRPRTVSNGPGSSAAEPSEQPQGKASSHPNEESSVILTTVNHKDQSTPDLAETTDQYSKSSPDFASSKIFSSPTSRGKISVTPSSEIAIHVPGAGGNSREHLQITPAQWPADKQRPTRDTKSSTRSPLIIIAIVLGVLVILVLAAKIYLLYRGQRTGEIKFSTMDEEEVEHDSTVLQNPETSL